MKRRRSLRRFNGRLHPVYWMGGTPANTTSTTTTNLSPELAAQIGPFADFAKGEVARPYKPYRGQLVAGFNPDQIDAFNMGRGGSGAYEQYGDMLAQGPFQGGVGASENEADAYLRKILSGGNVSAQETQASNFLGGFFDPNFQNPYFEEQLGIGRKRIGEEYEESIAPGLAGKYAMAGAFGGTAASEAESKSQRELVRGLQEYETGSRSAEQERRYAQGLQAAGLVEGTAARRGGEGLQASGLIEGTAGRRAQNSLMDAQLRSGIIGQQEGAFQNDFTRLLGIGAQQQELNQKGLNAKYDQFLRKQAYPRQTFDLYRDAIAALTGAGGGGSTQSGTTSGGGPSDAQTAAGAATTAAALYALYAASSACWVAREVFGPTDIRWILFRSWLMECAPEWFREAYLRHGPRWAFFLERKPGLKKVVRWWMERRIRSLLISPTRKYRPLDGGGSYLKYPILKEAASLGRVFDYAFEWCSGMGEIGIELVKNGICKRLCLADINPEAIAAASDLVRKEGLQDKVDLFISDNMTDIPKALRFDLVVSNPPNYYNIQKRHPMGEVMFHDLRPNDRGWDIHKKFYASIRPYLQDDAVMLISEVEPERTEVFIPPELLNQPYDVRDQVPMDSFREMTGAHGLEIVEVRRYHEMAGVGFFMLKIIKDVR